MKNYKPCHLLLDIIDKANSNNEFRYRPSKLNDMTCVLLDMKTKYSTEQLNNKLLNNKLIAIKIN